MYVQHRAEFFVLGAKPRTFIQQPSDFFFLFSHSALARGVVDCH